MSSEACQGSRSREFAASSEGFSLIELLIVVAIILIIAAIAIPNLLRSRIAANQSSAVSSMRTIITAENAYSCTYVGYSSGPGLTSLGTVRVRYGFSLSGGADRQCAGQWHEERLHLHLRERQHGRSRPHQHIHPHCHSDKCGSYGHQHLLCG